MLIRMAMHTFLPPVDLRIVDKAKVWGIWTLERDENGMIAVNEKKVKMQKECKCVCRLANVFVYVRTDFMHKL